MGSGTVRGLRADAVMTLSILLLGCFLCFAGSGLMDQWQRSAARRQALDIDDLLGAFAFAAGLAIVAWWLFSMMLAAAAAVLEAGGRRGAASTVGRMCPGFMRRLAVAALAVQLLSAPLAHAAEPPSGPAWVPTQEVTAQESTPEAAVESFSSPGPSHPQATEVAGSDVQPHWRPSAPAADPGLLASQPVRAAQDAPPSPGEVTVLAGDTLWDIASRYLGPGASDVDVALHWPRWYEANKAQIGENPHVLLPGQILKTPSLA